MLKPVYALAGSDLFTHLDKLGELLRAAPRDVQRLTIDGPSAQLADVLDELRSFAMFSSAKILIVRDADEFVSRFRQSLEEYVAKPSESSTLILRLESLPANQRIHKLIAASGEVIDCNPPKDIVRWIIDRARNSHKLSIGPQEAGLLQEMVGGDLGRLDNELAKLALQCEGKVDGATILRSVSFQREQEMWDMTDELAAGNVTRAMQRWRQLVQLDSSAEFRAMTWLTMWLEKVRKALLLRRQGKGDSMIARELKIWPFEKQRPFFQNAAAIGEAGAARLIELLADLDYRSKSGLGEMAENVERFLLAAKSH